MILRPEENLMKKHGQRILLILLMASLLLSLSVPVSAAAKTDEEEAETKVLNAINSYVGSLNGKFISPYLHNGIAYAWQCCAFVNSVWKNIFGVDYYDDACTEQNSEGKSSDLFGFLQDSNARAGDILWCHNGATTHYMIILAYDESGVWISDGGGDDWGTVLHNNEKVFYDGSYSRYFGGSCSFRLYQVADTVYEAVTGDPNRIYSSSGQEEEHPHRRYVDYSDGSRVFLDDESDIVDRNVKQPGCITEGYTTSTCRICGRTVREDYQPARGHMYYCSKLLSSSSAGESATYTCRVCGDTYRVLNGIKVGGTFSNDTFAWSLEEGVLTVYGTGALPDLPEAQLAPWAGENITKIFITEGITAIGRNNFSGEEAVEIYIAEGVSFIGESAFSDCGSLQTVHLPESIRYIAKNAFSNCSSLKNIDYAGDGGAWERVRSGSGNEDFRSAEVRCGA
jgi:hypothetical protein